MASIQEAEEKVPKELSEEEKIVKEINDLSKKYNDGLEKLSDIEEKAEESESAIVKLSFSASRKASPLSDEENTEIILTYAEYRQALYKQQAKCLRLLQKLYTRQTNYMNAVIAGSRAQNEELSKKLEGGKTAESTKPEAESAGLSRASSKGKLPA